MVGSVKLNMWRSCAALRTYRSGDGDDNAARGGDARRAQLRSDGCAASNWEGKSHPRHDFTEVYEIVNRALQRYSEDRIGLVDYALESSGASVLNTRCSETYETKTALISLFGVPLWYQSQSPRVILQPDSNPGNCWAFRGSQGYAVIRLSSRIKPTSVTLDHIPRSLSPKSTIASAPKEFSVYGLEEETQKEGLLLGNFTYNQNGNPIQTFPLKVENISAFDLVELRIQSNWGHPEYTCIYRFRVHAVELLLGASLKHVATFRTTASIFIMFVWWSRKCESIDLFQSQLLRS
ncbi:unnamed protein product [Ranitomeya imitator]|uniref:SUN domain-containing protein n=1 Tax=Ranitomeya imitator TaxID=111125 RepID=A0ABN9L8R8_9NEOB|nr:unnamed protein product [Ranitomeya imitator]